jgi:hypothetical protein
MSVERLVDSHAKETRRACQKLADFVAIASNLPTHFLAMRSRFIQRSSFCRSCHWAARLDVLLFRL